MPDTASLVSGLLAGLTAGLSGWMLGPSAKILRRRRRRHHLMLPLGAGSLVATVFGAVSHDLPGSLLFAAACGAGASAATLDLTVRRVHDLNTLTIAAAGLGAAALSGTWFGPMASSLGSMAILALARVLTSSRATTGSLGLGDILFASACGLWIAPAHLPYALLAAVAATILLARPWRPDAARRIAFVPGLGVGYGAVALAAGLG